MESHYKSRVIKLTLVQESGYTWMERNCAQMGLLVILEAWIFGRIQSSSSNYWKSNIILFDWFCTSPFLKSHILELWSPNIIARHKSILKLERHVNQPLVYHISVDVSSFLPITNNFSSKLKILKPVCLDYLITGSILDWIHGQFFRQCPQ